MTYVGTPLAARALTAAVVAPASRQLIDPYTPEVQQSGPVGVQPGTLSSRFTVHWSALQVSAALQFGPPSVARIAKVRPGKAARGGVMRRMVAAVGVPPYAA